MCAFNIHSHSWIVVSSYSETILLEGSSEQRSRRSTESSQSDSISGSAGCLPTDGALFSLTGNFPMQTNSVLQC